MSQVSPVSSPSATPAQPVHQAAGKQPVREAYHPSVQQPAHQPDQQRAPSPRTQPPQPAQEPQQPASAGVSTLFPNVKTPSGEPQTTREKLNAGDQKWQWKVGMRAILVLTSIIGIGCAAWATAKYGPGKQPYRYELDDSWSIPWTLITFTIGGAWSAICIAVFFLRSVRRPVHPGAQVGVDLILWLAYIFTGLFATLAASSVARIGADGDITNGYGYYSSSSDGRYQYVASNNTWVYNSTSTSNSQYYTSSSSQRDCDRSSSSSYYYSSYTFSNCTEEDLFVNDLWHTKGHRFNVELTVAVLQWLNLLLHFILFVWACVDTNRRNKRRTGSDAEKIAADIVMKMVQSGAIIPAPGQAHMRPMGPGQMPGQMSGQYPPQMQHYFPQQFPQQYAQPYAQPYPQQQLPNMAQPGAPTGNPVPPTVASSSNEKSAGARFA